MKPPAFSTPTSSSSCTLITDERMVLWGEGIWIPNKTKGPGGKTTPEPVSPGRVTDRQAGCHQPDEASPPPQVRRHHLQLHLLFVYSCPFRHSHRLLVKVLSLPAFPRHFRLCVIARLRSSTAPPPVRPPAARRTRTRTSRACAFSFGTWGECRSGEPKRARTALLYSLEIA